MKLFAATLLTHSRHEDSNIMFTVSESNTRKSTNFMKAVICMPNKSLYTVSSVPDLVGYKMAFYKHESTDRVSYAVMTNPVSAGVTEAKGDTSETYMGQACAQLVILGRIRFQQNLIEPNGTIIVYSFRFSQNFFQVIQATFPRGFFSFFDTGNVDMNTKNTAVFRSFPGRPLDFLNGNDRRKICRIIHHVILHMDRLA